MGSCSVTAGRDRGTSRRLILAAAVSAAYGSAGAGGGRAGETRRSPARAEIEEFRSIGAIRTGGGGGGDTIARAHARPPGHYHVNAVTSSRQ